MGLACAERRLCRLAVLEVPSPALGCAIGSGLWGAKPRVWLCRKDLLEIAVEFGQEIVTKEYGSSWIFELQLTCANAP